MNNIKLYIKIKLREGLNEKFNVIQNTLDITEPYDSIKSFNINGKKVYALFGDVMAAYRQQYPHLSKDDTVGSIPEVRFDSEVPDFLKK